MTNKTDVNEGSAALHCYASGVRNAVEAIEEGICIFGGRVRSDLPLFMQWELVPDSLKDRMQSIRSEHVSNVRI